MHVPYPNRSRAHRIFSSRQVWLVPLLLAAWALRLYHLDTMSLWWDEALSWDRATNTLPAILSNTIQIQTIATRDLHPPFYFVLLHFVTLFAGTSEFALRFLSASANVLTLAMFVPLARVLIGKRGEGIGLLAILFGALSPFYVWYSQEVRPYTLVLFVSVLCVYALLRWLKTKPRRARNIWSRWSILFALAFAATLVTHYLSFVLLPFFAATILLFGVAPTPRVSNAGASRLRVFRENPLSLVLAAWMLVAFVVVLFLMPRETDMTSWDQAGPRFVPLFIMLRDVWNSFAVGLTLKLDQAELLNWFLLALWLVGIFSLVRVKPRDARRALFLFAFLLVPALALQLGSYLRPLYLNSRHLITTSPAFYLGLAVGVSAVGRAMRLRLLLGRGTSNVKRETSNGMRLASWIVVVVLAGVYVAGAWSSLNNLYFNEAFAKDDHKAWAQFLRERWRADDYLFLVAPQAEKVVEYYLPDGVQWESLPHLGQTRDWQEVLDRQAILKAYRNHPRVWLLELHQPVADPTLHITDLLKRWGYATDSIPFRGISTEIRLQAFVYHQLPQEPPQPFSKAEQIVFARGLELVGADAPKEIQAGARGVVNLYWRARKKIMRDVNVSLRVVDEAGAVWGQWDAPPIGPLQPLAKWETDKTYLDQHDLVVEAGAPPGRYFVEINVYSPRDGERWTTHRGGIETDAPLRIAEINITRPNPPRDPRTLVFDTHTDIAFGDALRFVGYDLEERTTGPGSEIPLTLYFQVLRASQENVNGKVELGAPWWQFWNRTFARASFTLDLQNRQAGEIVQARVNVRVPGDASAGAYDLRVALEGANAVFGNVRVDAIARSTDLPSISHPLTARFGDKIELLGYDLDAPQPSKPNAPVRLTLYWRALNAMDTSYTVFTHLINADEKIFGQRDKIPLDGARPTTSWAAGEIFTDVYEFNVAPDASPGNYKIEIGFYTTPDFARLPTFDANGNATGDRVLLADLRVQ